MSITATLRNGTTARGKAFATTVAKTPRIKCSLWIESDEPLLGITYRFMTSRAALNDGALRVHSRAIGPAFGDITQQIILPWLIGNPAEADWGGTVERDPLPPGIHRVATFDISVRASKPNTEYGFWLDNISMVARTDDREQAIGATFFIRRQ